jgi:hypothetical protein
MEEDSSLDIVWLGIDECPKGTLCAPYLFNSPPMPMTLLDNPTNNVERFSNFRKNKNCSEGPPPYIYAKNLREDHHMNIQTFCGFKLF